MALEPISTSILRDHKEAIKRMAGARDKSVSEQTRLMIEMGFDYLEVVREQIRSFISPHQPGPVFTDSLFGHLFSYAPFSAERYMDSVIDQMVEDGELRWVDKDHVIKTDRMPATLHRVTR